MKILIAGASGFIGSHLTHSLRKRGHAVVALSRHRQSSGDYLLWDPDRGSLDAAAVAVAGFQAVINLAGESVAERWNARKKQRIYTSRVNATTLLSQTIAGLPVKPKAFLCASAIGYYGNRGDAMLTEESAAGDNFLSKVCADWEQATKVSEAAGIRTVNMRFGIVLGTAGGALPRMLVPFQLGAGGRLGTGRQYMSWVDVDDAVAAIEFLLERSDLFGPFNIVAPDPVTNIDFTQALGSVLRKPTIMPVPVAMAHLAFGSEMADQVFLASARVLPQRLSAAGFNFQYPKLQAALAHILLSPQ